VHGAVKARLSAGEIINTKNRNEKLRLPLAALILMAFSIKVFMRVYAIKV